MTAICPNVTPKTPELAEYETQMQRIAGFAKRIHIDLMDGELAPSQGPAPIRVWWPEGVTADIHLMFKRPVEHLETLISLHPSLIILHAEADGDVPAMLSHIRKMGIRAGVALLQATSPEAAKKCIEVADHVLVFSGDLGYFGGRADLTLLDKIPVIKSINPSVEIGWDGGASLESVADLAAGGVDVIYAGGAVQNADDPEAAYTQLQSAVG